MHEIVNLYKSFYPYILLLTYISIALKTSSREIRGEFLAPYVLGRKRFADTALDFLGPRRNGFTTEKGISLGGLSIFRFSRLLLVNSH